MHHNLVLNISYSPDPSSWIKAYICLHINFFLIHELVKFMYLGWIYFTFFFFDTSIYFTFAEHSLWTWFIIPRDDLKDIKSWWRYPQVSLVTSKTRAQRFCLYLPLPHLCLRLLWYESCFSIFLLILPRTVWLQSLFSNSCFGLLHF